MESKRRADEHTFSIEMKSRSALAQVSLSDKPVEPVLIKGELGKLDDIYFQEEVTLEIQGSKGTLRLDISREELETLLQRGRKYVPV